MSITAIKNICGLVFLICFYVSSPVEAAVVPVSILWEYKGLPATMKIYEPGASPLTLWQMGTAAKLEELPVSAEIPQATLNLAPGMKKQFVLVYQNTSAKPVRFFAAPHHATPAEYSLGFKFHCLCINHIYEVKPGEYWYRVVELTLAREFVGDRLNIMHVLVQVDDARKNPGEMNHDHGF